MMGRWTIRETRTPRGLLQLIGGAEVPGEATWVVPCDDEAVERGAMALHAMEDTHESWDSYKHAVPIFAQRFRDEARAVLRAAGETP